MENTKFCTYCNTDHLLTNDFWYFTLKPSGNTSSQCRARKNSKTKANYLQNRDSILAKGREEYHNNPEKYLKKRESLKDYNSQYLKTWRQRNPTYSAEYNRQYWQDNKHRLKDIASEYYKENKESISKKKKEYQIKNKDSTNEKFKKRYYSEPEFKIRCNLRNRLRIALQSNYMSGMAISMLGLSIEEFKNYLESMFQPGMTWGNHSVQGWHIDHIVPLASVDLTDPEALKKVSHFSNLRPCWAKENIKRMDAPVDLISETGILFSTEKYSDRDSYHLGDLKVTIWKMNSNPVKSEGLDFYESELRYKSHIVKSIIANKIGTSKKVNARLCSVVQIGKKEGEVFFNQNHLMGFKSGVKNFALMFEGEVVSCMAVSVRDGYMDINRFANRCGLSVRGGFSRLLKHSTSELKQDTVVSFCDLRYADGRSYQKMGFELVSTTQGWGWTDGKFLFNRLYCRANMDERNLSESEYAKEMGLWKIRDCGQVKYLKRLALSPDKTHLNGSTEDLRK